MPISDEALQSAKNRFIAVSAEATVGQAIAALRDLAGQPWWHLVVQMDDGVWGVTKFTDLHASLEKMATAAEVRLGGRTGLTIAAAVERDSIETKAALALAGKSPGRVLVVTTRGIPVGILFEGASRGGLSISSATLGELGGKYVNLKDYGSILLSSSNTGGTRPKVDATPAKT